MLPENPHNQDDKLKNYENFILMTENQVISWIFLATALASQEEPANL